MVDLISDVACTVCGCVCDDLRLRLHAGRITQAENACPLAEPWFDRLMATLRRDPSELPSARIQGQPATVDDALKTAADLLTASRSPLIYGLSRSSTPGQRAAVRLTESLGGTIDTTASVCHGPSIMAIQQVGESASTLGEIRERSDLVIFWGCDPVESHPRHLERYSLEPSSRLLPRGRADRTLVVVDTQPTRTSALADSVILVRPGSDFEIISALRLLISGGSLPEGFDCGVPVDDLHRLADRMTSCRYGVIFFGLGLAQQPQGHLLIEILLSLVAELNAHTRFTARRMRIPGDVSGADSVLCWQTGYPFAVNLNRGFPRYNPGEFTAADLLIRREVDACLIVGSESLRDFPDAALSVLNELPLIVLDYPHVETSLNPDVQFTTAVYGIHVPGTAYRMDEIPVPLRGHIPAPFPTDHAILDQLSERVTAVPLATACV